MEILGSFLVGLVLEKSQGLTYLPNRPVPSILTPTLLQLQEITRHLPHSLDSSSVQWGKESLSREAPGLSPSALCPDLAE